MDEKKCKCCSERKKERADEEYRSLMNRLNRIEGQIRGIKGMLENSAYCPDILMQVSAVSSALSSFGKELLGSHIKSCVISDVQAGNTESADELIAMLQRLMR